MQQSEHIQLQSQLQDPRSIQQQIEISKQDPLRFLNEDFLMVLIKHTKDCEREGKLDQARQARKRLKELRILEENKRKADLFDKHVSALIADCSEERNARS